MNWYKLPITVPLMSGKIDSPKKNCQLLVNMMNATLQFSLFQLRVWSPPPPEGNGRFCSDRKWQEHQNNQLFFSMWAWRCCIYIYCFYVAFIISVSIHSKLCSCCSIQICTDHDVKLYLLSNFITLILVLVYCILRWEQQLVYYLLLLEAELH